MKWDKQERKYYPIEINLYEKGEIDDNFNFEQDQQDAMKKTENIQSLADQVEMLEGLHKRIETAEEQFKRFKKETRSYIRERLYRL